MKYFKRIVAVILTACIALLIGCSAKPKNSVDFINSANFVTDAKIEGNLFGQSGSYFDIVFKSPTTLNTVVLKEKGSSITSFTIQIFNDVTQIFDNVYTQDEIGDYRYCAFNKVTTSKIRVLVSSSADKFTITSAEAYNVNHLVDENQQDFRATSYILADRIYDINNLNSASFDAITDVILFGATSFDENGLILYNDQVINDVTVPGKAIFETALSNLRQVIGDRKVRIHVNFLGPSSKLETDDGTAKQKDMNKLHNKAFKKGSLVNYLGQFSRDFHIDGIMFDYEYPLKNSDKKIYSNFLVDLKKELGDKCVGAALSSWNLKGMTKDAIEALDLVEIMAYDDFDKRGNHSDFNRFISVADEFIKKGFDPKKLDMGIPFYARPTDGAEYWYDYKSEAASMGEFGNFSSATEDSNGGKITYGEIGRYYNSPQMVFDKTAFAMNYGVGGVMMWHYSCDLPMEDDLSLLRSINDAIDARSK